VAIRRLTRVNSRCLQVIGREFLSADPTFRVDNDPRRVMLKCPTCESNTGVRNAGSRVVQAPTNPTPRVTAHRPNFWRPLSDASGCNAILVYNMYKCINPECPGRPHATRGTASRTFCSHEPAVVALLPPALREVLPADPRSHCWVVACSGPGRYALSRRCELLPEHLPLPFFLQIPPARLGI